ncbi:hypothetical protein BKP64_17585 [Marinobacter salinus]|uniref:Zinc finger/thioredoxin putative domain-containing protein n=1 Tax=Marinobacter salinus TaxID=1874317 RepID=A0A1D9GQC1_9GAMM|nr:DUF3426 domain-containing protein [Marinobacter salinus]AOY89833.1 hypothetical protein BKP64_17585 [Marinobacter salinus]
MTQSSLQTQCPNCQTRFRVTDEQLGIAKGKVRCGNCMEVFNAIEHQVIPRTAKPGAARPTIDSSPGTSAATPENRHATEEDFVFADNPEEDAAEGPYAGTKLTFSDDELSDSFRTVDETAGADFQDTDEDVGHEKVDESWAEAILQDSDKPSSAPAVKEQPPAPTPKPEPVSTEPAPTLPEPDDFYEPLPAEPGFDFDRDDNRNPESMAATMPFNDLRRDPVSVGGGNGGKLRTVLWTLVVLALAGTLVAQVTWFQFDRLSSIPELRPFYEKGCELAGCELQPLINVDAIQSRKLVVRTDPDNRSQLLVDAVIINRAAFEQPFPAIALTFSNLNGDIVAQSIFTPDEYLAGEGRNLEAMPQGTPVRIAINIRDPGRDAVNYNINFRPVSP